jgi:hypothetical protein
MRAVLLISSLLACLFLPCKPCIADEPLIKVNPVGQPAMGGDSARYFLWYDAEGWHLRTDTGGKRRAFTGMIDVAGGKVTSIFGFENLEAKKKKKKADVGIVNKAKDKITFKFATKSRRDGFDFQVNEAAQSLRFKLMIDGSEQPARVIIGAAGQPAPTAGFSLPAHPQ